MTTGWEDWQWDETLFRGTASFYERGRLPNAPGLADAFETALGLTGVGRLLDVGSGPGTITLGIAHLFADVVGVDADPDMVEEAQRLATARKVSNARFVLQRAEQLPANLGLFRTVTFAASFHWMNRPVVARTVRGMLDSEGAVVHVDNRHQDSLAPSTLPAVPRTEIDNLRRLYLGPNRRAGASIRNTSPNDEASIFRAAGFEGPETIVVPDQRDLVRSIDDVVAEVFSMSSTAPHLFGERMAEFESGLRDLLAETAGPGATFGVRLPDNELNIWRPTER